MGREDMCTRFQGQHRSGTQRHSYIAPSAIRLPGHDLRE